MAVHKIDGVDGVNHFPKKFVTLYGTAAITKGAWVALNLSDTTNGLGASVVTAPMSTAAGDPLVFGVATETTAAAGIITIQTAGRYGDDTTGGGAMTDGNITAGLPLAAGNDGSAGQIDQYEAGTHTNSGIVGIALSADDAGDYGANEATVMIIDLGYF